MSNTNVAAENQQEKMAYEAPELVTLGSVAELTRGNLGGLQDLFGSATMAG